MPILLLYTLGRCIEPFATRHGSSGCRFRGNAPGSTGQMQTSTFTREVYEPCSLSRRPEKLRGSLTQSMGLQYSAPYLQLWRNHFRAWSPLVMFSTLRLTLLRGAASAPWLSWRFTRKSDLLHVRTGLQSPIGSFEQQGFTVFRLCRDRYFLPHIIIAGKHPKLSVSGHVQQGHYA